MPTYSYESTDQPVVRIDNCSGDLKITGWDQATIEVTSDDVQDNLHHDNARMQINNVDDDLELRVPRGATIQIENADGDVQVRDVVQIQCDNVGGDALVQTIAGNVDLDTVGGDLNIEQAERVQVRGTVSGDLRVVRAAGVAAEHTEGDARIRDVPTVQLGHVSGDLRIDHAEARCDIGHVEGDAACNDAGALTIGHVGGDAAASRVRDVQIGHVEGDCAVNGETVTLRLGNIGGDAAVRVDTGTLTMGNIQGDAALRGAFDQITLGTIQGDLALQARLTPGGTYRAQVLGDAAVDLPDDANVTLHAYVVGDIVGAGLRTDHPTNLQLVWGAGEAALHLHVIGDLAVRGAAPGNVAITGEGEGGPGVYVEGGLDLDMGRLGRDLANMGREIAASFGPRVRASRRGRKGGWHASVKLGPEQKDQIRQQVRAGMEQAQTAIRQALREAGAPPAPPSPPAAPAPGAPATGVTVPLQAQAAASAPPPDRDAERLAILRMVQEGTVTPEEAEDLLAALEG